MPQLNEEIILKRYESLPDDLKEALMGVNTADAIYEIGRRANLNVEKIGALAEEIGLIILGFTPSTNFISDLKTALGIDEEKASEIASEVNERVFLPIRESLKRLHGASWSDGLVKPPTKFEGQKGYELKTRAAVAETKPEEKIAPAAPKEPLLIKPLGIAGAEPESKLEKLVKIPPAAEPTRPPTTITSQSLGPAAQAPEGPGTSATEPKLQETKPVLKPQMEAKTITPPIQENRTETKIPPPPKLETNKEELRIVTPAAGIKPETTVPAPTPTVAQPPKPVTPTAATPPLPPAPQPKIPEGSAKVAPPPPQPRQPGFDPYREPIE